jgi:hypothetical protein
MCPISLQFQHLNVEWRDKVAEGVVGGVRYRVSEISLSSSLIAASGELPSSTSMGFSWEFPWLVKENGSPATNRTCLERLAPRPHCATWVPLIDLSILVPCLVTGRGGGVGIGSRFSSSCSENESGGV